MGQLLGALAVTATAGVICSPRHLNVPVGMALVAALSFRRGPVRERYGDWSAWTA